ncbi:MAG: GMC family oxidoreductase [Alphaproteobacteria bacterium]|nr:GMC family oxidoreductase [Alphaproteobacteria bacterium]
MICDAQSLPDESDGSGEVLVIGSGPVGLVIARRLAELGVGATVLEAGVDLPDGRDRDCLNVEFSDQVLEGVQLGRTRQLGGGLNLWGGQLARFHATTLDGPRSPWPIDADELAAPFKIASRLLGASQTMPTPPDFMPDMKARMARFRLEPIATTWLSAPKWTRTVWSELERSRRIRIVLGAAASAIVLDRTTGRVRGVVARTRDQNRRVFTSRVVIIAAGTIESVRLLLQPAEDAWAQPWHELPWLGRGFCEHLEAAVAKVAVQSQQRLADYFDPAVGYGVKQTWKLFGRVALDEAEDLCGVVMLSAPGNLRNSLAELRLLLRTMTPRTLPHSMPKMWAAVASSVREVGPLAWRYLRHRRIGSYFRGSPILRASIEQPIRWQNRLELATGFDCLGIRRVKLHWRTGCEEGIVLRTLAERAAAWIEAEGMGRAEIDPGLLHDPEAFAQGADEGLHHAGGARMSVSARDGVVDSNLGVHGVEGLYVCSAAVFPRADYANPTLPAAALGVRLAQHLARSMETHRRSAA